MSASQMSITCPTCKHDVPLTDAEYASAFRLLVELKVRLTAPSFTCTVCGTVHPTDTVFDFPQAANLFVFNHLFDGNSDLKEHEATIKPLLGLTVILGAGAIFTTILGLAILEAIAETIAEEVEKKPAKSLPADLLGLVHQLEGNGGSGTDIAAHLRDHGADVYAVQAVMAKAGYVSMAHTLPDGSRHLHLSLSPVMDAAAKSIRSADLYPTVDWPAAERQ